MNKKILTLLIITTVFRVLIFVGLTLKDWKIIFPIAITTLGVIVIPKKLKKALWFYPVIIVIVLVTNQLYKPFEFGFNNTQVPIWLTDEQRREHGRDYNNPLVLLIHNKIINYSFSFLDHYFSYFQGDFLFMRNFLYFFDAPFICIGLWLIVKKSKGWEPILIWLVIAPITSAFDFQPPDVLKAANMFTPFVIISNFGVVNLVKFFLKWSKIDRI